MKVFQYKSSQLAYCDTNILFSHLITLYHLPRRNRVISIVFSDNLVSLQMNTEFLPLINSSIQLKASRNIY